MCAYTKETHREIHLAKKFHLYFIMEHMRKILFHQTLQGEETKRSSNALKRLDFNSISFSSAFTPMFCFSVSSIAASSFLSSSAILNTDKKK